MWGSAEQSCPQVPQLRTSFGTHEPAHESWVGAQDPLPAGSPPLEPEAGVPPVPLPLEPLEAEPLPPESPLLLIPAPCVPEIGAPPVPAVPVPVDMSAPPREVPGAPEFGSPVSGSVEACWPAWPSMSSAGSGASGLSIGVQAPLASAITPAKITITDRSTELVLIEGIPKLHIPSLRDAEVCHY